jgi:membrane protease YdiL (CAAX protease family)
MLYESISSKRLELNPLVITAWGVTLLVSLLPNILFQELTGSLPAWLFWAKLGLAGGMLLVSGFLKPVRPLRLFFAVLFTLFLLEWSVPRALDLLAYKSWLAGSGSFIEQHGLVQIPRVASAGLLMLVMLALVRSFRRFFFVVGDLNAPAAPIPLVTRHPSRWGILGPAISAALPLGLLAFVFVFGRPPGLQSLGSVLPLLPIVFLFAAANAFGEEMLYRAPWLSSLEGPIGPTQALLLTAVYFGIAHFYGVPYGVVGVIMSFIPGYLMGKAMLETRGFFWAWFIHFCMDVVIFFFLALGSITPGG